MTKSPDTSLAAITSTLKRLSARAKELRAKTSSYEEEIRSLRDAPVSLDDFAQYLRKWIEQKGGSYANQLWFHDLTTEQMGFRPPNKLAWSELESTAHTPKFWPFPQRSDLFLSRAPALEFLCFFMPEVVFEKLFSEVKKQGGRRWGNTDLMPVAQRVTTIETLTAEIEKMRPELNAAESEISKISGLIADAVN